MLNLTNGTEFYSDEKWTVDFTADDSLSGIDTAVFTIDGTEWLKGDVLKETEFGKFKRDGCGCKVKV